MKKSILQFFQVFIFILFFLFFSNTKSFAWGPEGHAIVGRLALKFVKADVRDNVFKLLGTMPVDSAANWMDKVKSNADYDFMRSWHYLDLPKGTEYIPTNKENLLNRLILTYAELEHKQILCEDQVRTDLLILLHLMGDMSMPLHAGYEDDLGGNKVTIQYDTIKNHNLHRFWDEDIIALTKITDADCLNYYDQYKSTINDAIDFQKWIEDTRSLLPQVYAFNGFILEENYLLKNKKIVEQQLLKSALHLAAVLNKLFSSPADDLDFKKISSAYKNSVAAADAKNHTGKKVTVCEKVYNVRSTPALTQISVGGKNNAAPLTVVIFARNYANFPSDIMETFRNKNICVTGTIEDYKGKAQIVLENMDDVDILFPEKGKSKIE